MFQLKTLPKLSIVPKVLVDISYLAIDNVVDGFQAEDSDAAKTGSPPARIGQAMHRLLQWGEAGPVNLRAVEREFALNPADAAHAASMAQRILHGDGAWAWRSELLAWQGNEVGLMYQGEMKFLDRLVRRKDTLAWWVLDYKSHSAPLGDASLVEQLQTYREAVRAIYPGDPVRAAFLTAQGAVVELPYGSNS